MVFVDNQGCFFSYIHGYLDVNSDEILVSKIDNLNYPNVVFFKELEVNKKNLQVNNTKLDIFSIVCREEISKEIENTINNCLKSNTEINFDELTIQSFVSYIKYYFKDVNKISKINVLLKEQNI